MEFRNSFFQLCIATFLSYFPSRPSPPCVMIGQYSNLHTFGMWQAFHVYSMSSFCIAGGRLYLFKDLLESCLKMCDFVLNILYPEELDQTCLLSNVGKVVFLALKQNFLQKCGTYVYYFHTYRLKGKSRLFENYTLFKTCQINSFKKFLFPTIHKMYTAFSHFMWEWSKQSLLVFLLNLVNLNS